jgi:hypothetical protein
MRNPGERTVRSLGELRWPRETLQLLDLNSSGNVARVDQSNALTEPCVASWRELVLDYRSEVSIASRASATR